MSKRVDCGLDPSHYSQLKTLKHGLSLSCLVITSDQLAIPEQFTVQVFHIEPQALDL